ncbi:hypothetical protein REPUB_Repub11eG0164700 [Reevesia pubescens]
MFSPSMLANVILGLWGLVLVLFIISTVVVCCNEGFRACFRRGLPPQDIETGEPSNVVPEAETPEMQQPSSMPILAGTIIVYKNEEKERNCTESCAICLEELKDGDQCRVLSKCNHLFHQLCIDSWLVKAMNCPLCRGSVHNLEPTTLIESDSSESLGSWRVPMDV